MLTVAQDNRYTAYDNLHKALTLDPTPYAADEALKDIVADLGTGLTGINDVRKQKTRPNTGPSAAKATAKQLLADVGGEVAGDLFEYGTKTTNPNLQSAADYNSTDLFIMRGTRIYDTTGVILQLAKDQKTAMGKYAISAARIQELDDAREAFNTLRSGPRQQQIAGKAIGITIGQRFSALSTIVDDRFERAMRKYKRANKEFYDRVMGAREVIDRPGTHAAPSA